MKDIKTFIEKAVAGGMKEGIGWKLKTANIYWVVWFNGNGDETAIPIEKYILDPKVWQAVQRASGCKTHSCWFEKEGELCSQEDGVANSKMHRMIYFLIEKSQKHNFSVTKSIESFIKTL